MRDAADRIAGAGDDNRRRHDLANDFRFAAQGACVITQQVADIFANPWLKEGRS